MEIDTFISNVADLFENTDATLITPETEFKKLDEWSSLIALSLIAMVDCEYDVRITGDDIRSAGTLKALFDIVGSK